MKTAIAGCLLLLLWATSANAGVSDFYLGGGITRTSVDTSRDFVEDAPDFDLDDDDNGWKIIAGLRLLDLLAAEANYVDFGQVHSGGGAQGGKYELTGFDAFAVLTLPVLPFMELVGKAGLIRWDAEGTVQVGGVTFSDSDSGTDAAYGLGVQVSLGKLAARLEYERFEVDNTDEVAMLSLSVMFSFL